MSKLENTAIFFAPIALRVPMDTFRKIIRGGDANGLLVANVVDLCGAGKYEPSDVRRDTQAGQHERKLHTMSGPGRPSTTNMTKELLFRFEKKIDLEEIAAKYEIDKSGMAPARLIQTNPNARTFSTHHYINLHWGFPA